MMTTPRIQSLFNYHRDLARFACNAEHPVFWVLDLEDEKAVNIALSFKSREDIAQVRDKERDNGAIAALTIASPLAMLNWYRTTVQRNRDPLPAKDGHIYMVLCTEGRFIVGCLPTMNAEAL